jgi:hypothetical protein
VIAIPATHCLQKKYWEDAALKEVPWPGDVTRVTATVPAVKFGKEMDPKLLGGLLRHLGILGFKKGVKNPPYLLLMNHNPIW